MFGPYGRLSPDLSGQCLNPSAVAGEALSGVAPPPGNLNRQFGGSSLDQNQTPQMATIGQIVQLVGSLDPNQMGTLHQFLGERMSLEGRGIPEFLGSCLVIQLVWVVLAMLDRVYWAPEKIRRNPKISLVDPKNGFRRLSAGS